MTQFGLGLLTFVLLAGLGYLVWRLPAATLKSLWVFTFAAVIVGGVTMMIAHSFLTRWGIRPEVRRDGLWAMMDGTADRPFVFRRLVPDLTNIAVDFSERHLTEAQLDTFLRATPMPRQEVMTNHQKLSVHFAYYLVWFALQATVVAFALLLRTFRACSWFEGLLSATLALCFLPLTLSNGGYVYDSWELLLWTLVVLSIARGWFLAVPPLFVVLLVNKESALAVVPVLLPLFWYRSGKKAAVLWCAGLGLAAAAWLSFIRHRYAGCPGLAQEWGLGPNLAFWSRPTSYFRLDSMFSPGLPAPRGGNLAILFLLAVPLRFGWKYVRRDFQWATALAALISVPLFLLSGCLDETRALGPLFPFLFVVCTEGVKRMLARAV